MHLARCERPSDERLAGVVRRLEISDCLVLPEEYSVGGKKRRTTPARPYSDEVRRMFGKPVIKSDSHNKDKVLTPNFHINERSEASVKVAEMSKNKEGSCLLAKALGAEPVSPNSVGHSKDVSPLIEEDRKGNLLKAEKSHASFIPDGLSGATIRKCIHRGEDFMALNSERLLPIPVFKRGFASPDPERFNKALRTYLRSNVVHQEPLPEWKVETQIW